MRQGKQNASQATKILNGYKGSDASDKPVKIFHRAFFHNKIMFGIERRKEMKLFGKKFALVLALAAVLAMAGSALADDIYVAENGNGDGTSQDSALSSVKDAVEKATAGDTIHIAAGTYAEFDEPLVINKSLELIGDENGGTIFTATLKETNTTPGQYYGDHMIEISGNIRGTVISNITFEATTEGPEYFDMAIVYITGNGGAGEGEEIRIENCTFTGKADEEGEATSVIAVLTPTYGQGNIVLNKNVVDNVKHGFFFNTVTNTEITNNTISNTTHNGINIYAPKENSKIVIDGNTLSDISTADEEVIEGEDMGIFVGKSETASLEITNNEINMAEGKQENALSGNIEQVAQVTTSDGRNIYHSSLADAVTSDKTTDGSKITLLSKPTEEDAQTVIDKNVTIDAKKAPGYKPVTADGGELIDNGDGTFTVKAPATQSAPAHSGGGSGGCSAGFGALALLAAVPLLFRRKK